MEFYYAEYNCKVRVTCGGVPFEQIPKPYIPSQDRINALARYLVAKYGNKDTKWPDEIEEEQHQ